MATIINNPTSTESSNGPMATIVGMVVLLVLGYLFFIYGIPAIRQIQFGSPQINVPSSIDVNVKQSE